jgi:hypothetical protein
MTQPDPLDPYHFEVSQGENISITTTAIGTNDLVEASLDGSTLEKPFKFTVTKTPPHRHVVAMQFDFDQDHTPDAKYTWKVSSDHGDSFSLPDITPNTEVLDPGLSFKVTA